MNSCSNCDQRPPIMHAAQQEKHKIRIQILIYSGGQPRRHTAKASAAWVHRDLQGAACRTHGGAPRRGAQAKACRAGPDRRRRACSHTTRCATVSVPTTPLHMPMRRLAPGSRMAAHCHCVGTHNNPPRHISWHNKSDNRHGLQTQPCRRPQVPRQRSGHCPRVGCYAPLGFQKLF